MPSITFYGGVNEIGGNKILLEDDGTRVFLDFGMSFKQSGKYFSEFIQPRKSNGLEDFLELGLIPDLEGIYRSDFLKHDKRKVYEEPTIDAVFLSHAHMDHMAYVNHLHEKLPIYCSEISYLIMKALEDTGTGSFSDLVNYNKSFEFVSKKRGEGLTRGRGLKEERIFEKFDTNREFDDLDNLSVKTAFVDHSLGGACGFIIETSAGNIVYTGDLRFHGYRSHQTEEFVRLAADSEPVALICEGTHIDKEKGISEEAVKEKIDEVVRDTEELVIVNFPVRDTDRLNTFFNVAKENDRKLAINLKQAYLLDLLGNAKNANSPKIDDSDLLIYGKKKRWGLVAEEDIGLQHKLEDYEKWERRYIEMENFVSFKDVRENQSEVVLYLDNYGIQELVNLKPGEGSCYIRSMCEPFDPEMELDWGRIENWLEHFGLMPIHQIHASGHASGPEIKELIDEINPERLFPVHTEHPELFKGVVVNPEMIKAGVPYEI